MNVDRILWLVSDTVRADYVGYGGGHVHTPNLDALAAVRCQVSRTVDDHQVLAPST